MAKESKKNDQVKEPEAPEAEEPVTAAAGQEATEPSEVDTLRQELAAEQDKYLRLLAEYDNFRKRSQREKETSYGDAKAQTLSQILPVVDNFERAANNTDASLEDYVKGVTMTFSQMMEILKKLEVEPYGESGESFDPQIHSAVMHVEDEALGENVITDVFQKGYRMGDRILRHAMVKVAN